MRICDACSIKRIKNGEPLTAPHGRFTEHDKLVRMVMTTLKKISVEDANNRNAKKQVEEVAGNGK